MKLSTVADGLSVQAFKNLPEVLSFIFFFHLRAHSQRVDYSGAYNWGCPLLYWSSNNNNNNNNNNNKIRNRGRGTLGNCSV